ncbi:hypothetical protein TGS27_0681 [Geobacillus stearothermophilus]|nr:hypothetical protein TGS27_0681 [Geobacillus stearothermophilus]
MTGAIKTVYECFYRTYEGLKHQVVGYLWGQPISFLSYL